ncbi:RxLR effector candidate protein [Phytophthora palmivora]|uniref:RxLR effector candidate protein n=1 Tax=Phytophthora palmivora TaxID=4796 RepID=A0A2P4YKH8_9STRA|nr:RxLR effector candidate protein [Phytophthora palmivora]
MDYRPITLLQTSYKILAKVVATRLQKFLGKLIGNSQQGFVHGRQMNKTVMMIMAQLKMATDDAAKTLEDIYMQKARQLRHVLRIVGQFGEMSGLHIQPAKSVLISLNTGIPTPAQILGIPILQRGEFTRYLGYQVGTTEAQNVDWADRIRKIQQRLVTACRVATSDEDRVEILNTIVLPAVLFTSAVLIPIWAAKQLLQLQKHFIWQSNV